MGGTAADVAYPLIPQRLNHPRLVQGQLGAVAQLAVVSLAPGEDPAVHSQGHGMLAPGMDGDLGLNVVYIYLILAAMTQVFRGSV